MLVLLVDGDLLPNELDVMAENVSEPLDEPVARAALGEEVPLGMLTLCGSVGVEDTVEDWEPLKRGDSENGAVMVGQEVGDPSREREGQDVMDFKRVPVTLGDGEALIELEELPENEEEDEAERVLLKEVLGVEEDVSRAGEGVSTGEGVVEGEVGTVNVSVFIVL